MSATDSSRGDGTNSIRISTQRRHDVASCVEVSAFGRSDENRRRAAAAHFGDVGAQPGAVGSRRFGVSLRPLDLLVVVAELDHDPVARLERRQQFVEAQLGDERLQRLARFGMVGDGDVGAEESRQHLSPAGARRHALIGDRRIAGEIQRGQLLPARCAARATGASPANSSVSLSSQVALPTSRGLSATLVPPVAFAGNGASSAVRTFTMKLRSPDLIDDVTSRASGGAVRPARARECGCATPAEIQCHAIVALGDAARRTAWAASASKPKPRSPSYDGMTGSVAALREVEIEGRGRTQSARRQQ